MIERALPAMVYPFTDRKKNKLHAVTSSSEHPLNKSENVFKARRSMGSRFWTATKLFVTVFLIVVILYRVDLKGLWQHLAKASPLPLFLGFMLLCVRNVVQALRWQVILRSMKETEPLVSLTRLVFIGIFCSLFFPTAVGGDIVRGFLLYRRGARPSSAVTSVLVDRFLGVSAVALLALASLFFAHDITLSPSTHHAIILFPVVCVSVAVILFTSTNQSVFANSRFSFLGKFHSLRKVLSEQFHAGKKLFIMAFFLSVGLYFIAITAIYLLSRSLECSTPFSVFAILLPIVWLLSTLPISIGGHGVREGAFVYLFSEAGMNQEMALAVSLLWLLLIIGQGLIGGILFLFEHTKL
ncbi:MAG: flippase-like domain-containing protein, partial [Deltaproteobacteria bacterium]|nr:flippase-like domain-containing protein [Deltaproteobacteria bacterium]